MADVLVRFDQRLVSGGVTYRVQACGAPMPDGLWEGWLEFIPLEGGTPLRSPRETTQPNRADAEYWATGLTPVYVEGAFERASNPPARQIAMTAAPAFIEPASRGPGSAPPDTGRQTQTS